MLQAVSPILEPWHRSWKAGTRRVSVRRAAQTERLSVLEKDEAEAVAREMSACICAIAERQDRAAFERVFRHFAPRVKAYLMRGRGDPAAAEEIMQEVMTVVWRKAALFDPSKSSAGTWIFTIARNLRIDAFRHARRPEFDPADPAFVPDDEPPADAAMETQQDVQRVQVALSRLSDAEQTVLRLAYFEEHSQATIAKQLGIPLGTVKSRVRLAFGKLRAALSDEGAGAKA